MNNYRTWTTVQSIAIVLCLILIVRGNSVRNAYIVMDSARHEQTDAEIAELSVNVAEIREWVNKGDRFTQSEGDAMNGRLLDLKAAIFEHIQKLEAESAEKLRVLGEIQADLKTLLKGP